MYGIEYRGKQDSVYIECPCGEKECVASWFTKCPYGWDKKYWKRTKNIINLFLDISNDAVIMFKK